MRSGKKINRKFSKNLKNLEKKTKKPLVIGEKVCYNLSVINEDITSGNK